MAKYDKGTTGIQIVHSKIAEKTRQQGFDVLPLFGDPYECLASHYDDEGKTIYIITTYDRNHKIVSYKYDSVQSYYIEIKEQPEVAFGYKKYLAEDD